MVDDVRCPESVLVPKCVDPSLQEDNKLPLIGSGGADELQKSALTIWMRSRAPGGPSVSISTPAVSGNPTSLG